MMHYVCMRGDADVLVMDDPSCVIVRNYLGRDWFCCRTDKPGVPPDRTEVDKMLAAAARLNFKLSGEGKAQDQRIFVSCMTVDELQQQLNEDLQMLGDLTELPRPE
jgi:hypothetical protein